MTAEKRMTTNEKVATGKTATAEQKPATDRQIRQSSSSKEAAMPLPPILSFSLFYPDCFLIVTRLKSRTSTESKARRCSEPNVAHKRKHGAFLISEHTFPERSHFTAIVKINCRGTKFSLITKRGWLLPTQVFLSIIPSNHPLKYLHVWPRCFQRLILIAFGDRSTSNERIGDEGRITPQPWISSS